jgi:acetyltransferase-like isoleucine patch superfamily enzyme
VNGIWQTELTDEAFTQMTRYINAGDTEADNRRRAILLGFDAPEVRIAPGAVVRLRSTGSIGRNVFIGLYCYINGPVTIQENVLIGPGCALPAGQHKFDPATGWFSARTESDSDESIVIGAGSWLCTHVTVTPGVKIGRANLICAGAVVTRSTADYAIMAGMPARQVGHIDPETGKYIWNKL